MRDKRIHTRIYTYVLTSVSFSSPSFSMTCEREREYVQGKRRIQRSVFSVLTGIN